MRRKQILAVVLAALCVETIARGESTPPYSGVGEGFGDTDLEAILNALDDQDALIAAKRAEVANAANGKYVYDETSSPTTSVLYWGENGNGWLAEAYFTVVFELEDGPTVDFSYQSGYDGVAFTVDANDPGDDIVNYHWSLGDGQEFTPMGPAEQAAHTHLYPKGQGQYPVELMITLDNGSQAFVTKTVNVGLKVFAYPASNGTGRGFGVSTIIANANSWSNGASDYYAQISKYDVVLLRPLWQTAFLPSTSSTRSMWEEVEDIRSAMPAETLVALTLRPDFWACRNHDGAFAEVSVPSEYWGPVSSGNIGVLKPTPNMGLQPRDGQSWFTAMSTLSTAGYSQLPTNAAITNAGWLLTNPYWLQIDAVTKKWWVKSNQMRLSRNDDAWIQLHTDYVVAALKLRTSSQMPDIILVEHVKIQRHRTGNNIAFPNNFHNWLEGTGGVQGTQGNPGAPGGGGVPVEPGTPAWDLASNTGGIKGPWSPPFSNNEAYDDKPEDYGVFELTEGMFHYARVLKAKLLAEGLTAATGEPVKVVFDPAYYANVGFWRNATHRALYRSRYVQIYGGSNGDADDHLFVESLLLKYGDNSEAVDGLQYPSDDWADDHSPEYNEAMRDISDGKLWIENPPWPQPQPVP